MKTYDHRVCFFSDSGTYLPLSWQWTVTLLPLRFKIHALEKLPVVRTTNLLPHCDKTTSTFLFVHFGNCLFSPQSPLAVSNLPACAWGIFHISMMRYTCIIQGLQLWKHNINGQTRVPFPIASFQSVIIIPFTFSWTDACLSSMSRGTVVRVL